jgi:NAD(P)-dependent dehydrogenase (short-subunit alcohol dehydrogenase family)
MAKEFLERYARLDVLVNNAGGFFIRREVSIDGIEMTFALNHLSYFLLTNLLLDRSLSSSPGRIVNVSSGAHYNGAINFEDLEFKKGYGGWKAYSQSKLANILFTYELARRLEGTGVTANALHPGFVATQLGHNNGLLARLAMMFSPIFGAKSPQEGARTSVYLASSPEVEGKAGKYFVDCEPHSSSQASHDLETARRLWEVSEAMTGTRSEFSDCIAHPQDHVRHIV